MNLEFYQKNRLMPNLFLPVLRKLFSNPKGGYRFLPLALVFILSGNFSVNAQVVINEILVPGRVELKNIGTTSVDIADYWLCTFPSYQRISALNIQCGNTLLVPGQILTVTNFDNFDELDGEIGLYTTNGFSNPATIVDYVEWGSTGHQRSSVAVAAGIWTTGDFVPAFGVGMSIEYDATGDASANWDATSSSTICTENSNIPLVCDVESGVISTTDATSICVDGVPDPIEVEVTGSPTGSLGAWIITDDQNTILALPNNPPFDLDGAGAGTCIIWYVRYDTGFDGNVVGNNLSDLTGCFDISNGITVNREEPDGGTVTLADGSTTYTGTAGDIMVDVIHTTTAPNLTYTYVITDDSNIILGFQNSTAGGMLDLSGAPAGTCRIRGWSHSGVGDPVMGEPINTLMDDACEAVTSSFITVIRNSEEVDGGTIVTDDNTTICVDGNPDPINVTVMGSSGPVSGWIITDDSENILATPNASPFDLDGAGVGTCIIWFIRFEDGLTGREAGNNLSDLVGNFDLSNGITVQREAADGGVVTLADGSTTFTGTAGDIIVDIIHTTASPNLPYSYIITDDSNNILGAQPSPAGGTLDLSGAPAGTCRIWGWSHNGTSDPVMGDPISTLMDDDCESVSTDFITVIRNPEVINGGTISTTDETITCIDGNPDPINVTLTGATGTNNGWIITDDANNILALPLTSTFDLEGAGVGVCILWHISYEDGLTGKMNGNNLSDLAGSFGLSNGITVTREAADGGVVTFADGSTTFTGTAGDIMVEVIHTTNAPNLEYTYVITDDDTNILGFQNSTAGGMLDLSGAPPGTCRIWGWSHNGLADPVMGESITSLSNDDCESITVAYLSVIRTAPITDGGIISTTDPTTICVDGNPDPINVTVMDAIGTNDGWIITDDSNNILALPDASPFDLDGAGVGTCIIWYIRYEDGLTGNVVGNNVSDLSGNFDLSNGITVEREAPDGGTVNSDLGTNIEICIDGVGDPITVSHVTASPNLSYWYIITDDADNILAWSTDPVIDLEGAGVGTCRIWGWNYRGLGDPVMGDPITSLADDDCEDISDNFITVVRVDQGSNCVVSTSDLNSVDQLKIYPNPASDFLQVEYEGLENGNGQLAIVDLLGRSYLQKDLNQTNDALQLDISEIPMGVYLIRINSENYTTIDRIVIMK